MSFKKISIITPSFNQGQYIEQTIDSVLSQNYPNLEYVIIDGGSTDGTIEIIKKYDRHIKYWVSEPDTGQTHAINKGLQFCSGDIVNWLNSDDFYNPNTLDVVNRYFDQLDPDVLLGNSRIFYANSERSQISKGGHLFKSLEKTIGDSLLDQPSAFFRMDIFKKFCPLDISLKYLMDRALWIKYLISYGHDKVIKIPITFVNFRMHDNSKTVSENTGFNLERDAIFKSLALTFAEQSVLRVFLDQNVEAAEIDWKGIAPICDIDKVLEEFYAVLYKEAYASNNFDKAKRIWRNMNLQKLSDETIAEVQSINRKTTLLPKVLLKWLKEKRS